MSTATSKVRPFNAAETQRRVRHPLQALRGHIRRYVIFEGLANAIIYLALVFWIGLAIDYGCFYAFGFDWVFALNSMTADAAGEPGATAIVVRVVLLSAIVLGLLALVTWKVIFRITREFRDSALALVLERRFPRDLGDRLITAVEMADPRVGEKYGFSRELIEHTIQDAANRVERVPVREVFNWKRLYLLGMWCGILTVGVYLLVAVGSIGVSAVADRPLGPVDFFWKFNDAAGIWTERTIFLRDSYWPRDAYLEIVRFQDTPDHPNEMRVGRDEERPDILVRSYEWVLADRAAPSGWRPLRWNDLAGLLGAEAVAKVNIPEDWPGWIIDLADLAPSVTVGVPKTWQGRTSGEIQAEISQLAANPAMRDNILLTDAKVMVAVADLLDWQTWTVDKILVQEQKGEVRRLLREQYPQAHDALTQGVLEQLAVLAESPSYSRTLRRLQLPTLIEFSYRGENTKGDKPLQDPKDNTFEVQIGDLNESVSFTVQAENFTTPTKKITLVPPPGLKAMTVDKEEPAYKYYRLQGDQLPLKGKKQLFKNYPISVTGEFSSLEVLIGSNVVLHGEADRKLRDNVRLVVPSRPGDAFGQGGAIGLYSVGLQPNQTSFSVAIPNVTKPLEFFFAFNDLDGVLGYRRVRLTPVDDRPPEVLDFEMDVVLRKPKFKAELGRSMAGTDGFLITPDALLPFKGLIRDDYGLTDVSWAFEVEEKEIELVGSIASVFDKDKKDTLPTLVLEGSAQERRAAIVVSGFQFLPTTPGFHFAAPFYWTLQSSAMQADLKRRRAYPEELKTMESYEILKESQAGDTITLNALEQALFKKPEPRAMLKDLNLKDKDRFLFPLYLKKLKSPDPQKQAQFHYLVKISVLATDNNVETGPNTGRSKSFIPLLVVSENELLSQVAIEEEVLRDRLDKAYVKLTDAKVFVDEAVKKLTGADGDYVAASVRVDEARKRLLDAGTTAREVANDYRRILDELEVNQVRKDKTEAVRFKIVFPLNEIVDANTGNFTLTEAAMEKTYIGLEDDLAAKRGAANQPSHLANAKESQAQLLRLMERLNDVLKAMDEGVVESKLLELIVNIERDQRGEAERLRRIYEDWVRILIDELTNPKK